jgi:hypothetical protein
MEPHGGLPLDTGGNVAFKMSLAKTKTPEEAPWRES